MLSSLWRIFFTTRAQEEAKLSSSSKYLIGVGFYFFSMGLVARVFQLRHGVFIDDLGYVATADYIRQHASLPTGHNQLYRQFPGLPLLMAALSFVGLDLQTAGHMLVIGAAAGCVFLIQYLFDDFRLTLISSFFFPFWLTCSVALFTETLTEFCFLITVWTVLRGGRNRFLYAAGLLVGGYALVLRQTAIFLLVPFVLTFLSLEGKRAVRKIVLSLLFLALPLAALLTWNGLTIHLLFPQYELQKEFLHTLNQGAGARYHDVMYDIPFKGIYLALSDPQMRIEKKIAFALTLMLILGSLVALTYRIRRAANETERRIASAFLAALATYFLFHVSLGGVSSFWALDRYLCPASGIVAWALFYRNPLRWPWIGLMLMVTYGFDMTIRAGPSSVSWSDVWRLL